MDTTAAVSSARSISMTATLVVGSLRGEKGDARRARVRVCARRRGGWRMTRLGRGMRGIGGGMEETNESGQL